MKHPLIIRLIVLGLLTLLLCIPILMVRGTIHERAGYRAEAVADIARSWGGRQSVTGPTLIQTWHSMETVRAWDPNLKTYVDKEERRSHRRVSFPDDLAITGDLVVEQRYRGIFLVPVYRTELTVSGDFSVPALPEDAREPSHRLILAVEDPRGLRAQPELTWNERALTVEPGTGTGLGGGVHAELERLAAGNHAFTARLALGGTEALALAPVGGSTRIELASNWPHPRFSGGYLPETREIDPQGFTASWRTTRYAATARETLQSCLYQEHCALGPLQQVRVEILDPVNVYALNDRSTKYALLFIVVVFGVFFVYEALKQLRIHPVQYVLVGLGQALFFLLLLSLSEHVAFGWAYLAGAGLSVALLTFYVSYVLGSMRRAAGFATLLAGIYGALYVMLQSEDYALLLGSMLLLLILASAMYLTRNLDWYAADQGRAGSPR